MAELSPTFEHEPLPPSGEGALDEGQKETKSSRDTSSTGAEVKQAILEIPNGQAIDGQPVAPGPQYKRGRGRSFFKDAPRKGVSCQVPGCDRSLHKLRDYYKRYKICPYHLELNCMVVEGQSIRFCQQCGRFQLLDEFDGDRRSCRRKLEKHNERRRKLEGCLTDSDSGGEGSGRSRSGLKYHRSGSPPRPWGIPPLPMGVGNGLDVNQMLQNLARDEYLMSGLGPSLAGGMHSLVSGGWMPSTSTGGGVVGSTSNGVVSATGGSGSHMHPDLVAVLAEVAAANTTNTTQRQQQQQQQQQQAIPVLTSEPAHPIAVRAAAGVTAQALQQFLRDGGAGTNTMSANTTTTATIGTAAPPPAGVPTIKSEPMSLGAVGSAFAWPPNGNSTQSTDDVSVRPTSNQNGSVGRGGTDNTRVAALAAAAAAASADEQPRWHGAGSQQQAQRMAADAHIGEMFRAVQSQISNGSNGGSQQLSSMAIHNLLNNNNSNGSGNPHAQYSPNQGSAGQFHPNVPGFALSGALGGNPQAPVVNQLFNLLQQLQNANAPRVPPEQDVMTLSMKLFKMTPAQLPPGLLHELTAWMTKTPTYGEIAMRPGCVHLTTSILSTDSERAWLNKSVSDTVRRALSNTGLGRGGAATEALLLQMQSADGPKAAIVLDGVLKMVLDLAATNATHRPPVPSLFSVEPLAATPDYTGSFLVLGQGMDANEQDTRIFCRTQGQNAQVEVINRGPALLDEYNNDATGTGGGWMQVAVPHLGAGGYALEVARGPFVSSPVGFVVIDDPVAVAEVRQLESDADGIADVVGLIQKVGLVVQMRSRVDSGVSLKMEMQDETVDRIAQVAQEVAAVSLKKGWPAVLRLALPVISAAMPAAQGLDCVSELLGTGVTPLSAAVVSGNAALVEVLGAWATVNGISLIAAGEESIASLGLTALHLAAMLNSPCAMATALNKWVTGAIGAWCVAPRTAAGVSPLSIAVSLGQDELLQMLVLQGVPCAAEALSAMYKERDLSVSPPSHSSLQQKLDSLARRQKQELNNSTNSDDHLATSPTTGAAALFTTPPARTSPLVHYDEGASSSSQSTSVRSSRATSYNVDDLSREPSIMSPLALDAILNDCSDNDMASMRTAAAAVAAGVATDINSGRSSSISGDNRRTRRAIIARESSDSIMRGFVLFVYQFVLTVLLPSLLPERIALGAAVLPAVVVASYSTVNRGAAEMVWSMFCAALMALMAISLNKSAAMASVRASAYEMLCSSPRIRAVVSTLWLLAVTNSLGLSRLQNAALCFVNSTICLIPLAVVNSGKEAWFRMTGAAISSLFLVVCVPELVKRVLERGSEDSYTARATAVEVQPLQQQQRQPLEEVETKAAVNAA